MTSLAWESLFKAFFASIPYQWHTNNEIANYEGYYASVFYSLLRIGGIRHRCGRQWQ